MRDAIFDKFEVRSNDASDSEVAFFSFCHPTTACVAGVLPINSCVLLADGQKSCHVTSAAGRPYALTLHSGDVTVAEATAAADIVEILSTCPAEAATAAADGVDFASFVCFGT